MLDVLWITLQLHLLDQIYVPTTFQIKPTPLGEFIIFIILLGSNMILECSQMQQIYNKYNNIMFGIAVRLPNLTYFDLVLEHLL